MALDLKTILNMVNPPCPENLNKKSIPIHLTLNLYSGNTVEVDLTDAQKRAWLPIMCSASFPYLYLCPSNDSYTPSSKTNFISLLDEILDNTTSGTYATGAYELGNISVGNTGSGSKLVIDLETAYKNGWCYIYANVPELQVDTYGIRIQLYIPPAGR